MYRTYLFFLSFRVYNLVAERSSFDANINVSVFETNIRIVGGLISAHLMARRAGVQLEQGKQLEHLSSLFHIFRLFITVPVQFFPLSEGLTITRHFNFRVLTGGMDFSMEHGCYFILPYIIHSSVPDPPDPRVFWPPGCGSTSQRYGSGSFYHHAKIIRKTLNPTICDSF
jgi:hypothetical protein